MPSPIVNRRFGLRLRDTADELKNAARKIGASPDDLYLRERAAETNVRALRFADYRIVYFATHGLVANRCLR